MRSSNRAAHPFARSHQPAYVRRRDLPRLLPIWPEDLADVSIDGRAKLVARLGNLLRRERQRGLAGDWCYDLSRHRQLVIAHRAEWQAWQQALAAQGANVAERLR